MQVLEGFVQNYDCLQYDMLPKFIKRRVDALKKVQLEHTKLQHQFNLELQDLEMKYEKLYQPLYEKRREIISGEHEPTDEECQLPPNILENEFNGDQENADVDIEHLFSDEEENKLKPLVKGIPGFWLGTLLSTCNFNDSIEEHDKAVLRFLKDIRLSYAQQGEDLTYKLEFHFDENPHFTNKVLTKTYFLKTKPDEKDPFDYEGFVVYKSEGSEIDWNNGKDITTKMVTVKQRNKANGATREKKKVIERDSFFRFFKPQTPEGDDDELDDELNTLISIDFTLGEVLRHSIIPKAVLYYNGYMDDEDEDDEEDDDDDDDDDDDSDHSGSESEDIYEGSDSNDSLNDSKDNKKLMPGKKSPKSPGKSG